MTDKAARIGAVSKKLHNVAAPWRPAGRKVASSARAASAAEAAGETLGPVASRFAGLGRNLDALAVRKGGIEAGRSVRAGVDEAARHPFYIATHQASERLRKLGKEGGIDLAPQEARRLVGEELRFRGERGDVAARTFISAGAPEAVPQPALRKLAAANDPELSTLLQAADELYPDWKSRYGTPADLEPSAPGRSPTALKWSNAAQEASEEVQKLRTRRAGLANVLDDEAENFVSMVNSRQTFPKGFTRSHVRQEARSQQRYGDYRKGLERLDRQITATEKRAATALRKMGEADDRIVLANIPAPYQPIMRQFQQGRKAILEQVEAGALPGTEAATLLSDVPDTISGVLAKMSELGVEPPQHFRDFTEASARVFGSGGMVGKPGRRLGQTVEAGTHRQRRMLLRNRPGPSEVFGAVETDTSAFLAMAGEVAGERVANDFVSTLLRENFARALPADGIVPNGWRVWDPNRILQAPYTEYSANIRRATGAPTTAPQAIKRAAPGTQWIVPDAVAKALSGFEGRGLMVNRGSGRLMSEWRASVLYLSPRWHLNNMVGNFTLATLEGSGLSPVAWGDAWRSWRGQRKSLNAAGDARVAFGDIPSEVVGASGFGLEGVERGTIANWRVAKLSKKANETADQFFRAMVYKRSVRKGAASSGLDADAIFAKTLAGETLDATETAVRDGAVQRALKAMVDYGDLSPFERQVVRRAVPFYAWQKGILKLALTMPLDHPLRFAALTKVSQWFGGFSREERETDPEFLVSSIDLFGRKFAARGVNPFQDAFALIRPSGQILQNLAPHAEAGIRFMGQVPETRFGPMHVGASGIPERSVTAEEMIAGTVSNLPMIRLALGMRDEEQEPSQAALNFFGIRERSPEQVAAAQVRLQKGRREALLAHLRAKGLGPRQQQSKSRAAGLGALQSGNPTPLLMR